MVADDSYERKLLEGWEEAFKKGQLTLWIMLALKDGAKHMAEIKVFIDTSTNGTLTADDQSMYRALRRYYEAELVDFNTEQNKAGPDRKLYSLTSIGNNVLGQFITRNVTSVFYKPQIKKLIEGEFNEKS